MNKHLFGGRGILVTESIDTIVVSTCVKNPKLHVLRSSLRVFGYCMLFGIPYHYTDCIMAAAAALLVSEFVGVLESALER